MSVRNYYFEKNKYKIINYDFILQSILFLSKFT